MARHILIIDRLITANHKTLERRAKLSARDQLSAAAWQRAWDANPELRAIDRALFTERHEARQLQWRAEERAARRAAAAERARYRAAAQAERLSADCA